MRAGPSLLGRSPTYNNKYTSSRFSVVRPWRTTLCWFPTTGSVTFDPLCKVLFAIRTVYLCAIEHTLCIFPSERSTSATSCFKLQSQAGLLRTTFPLSFSVHRVAPPQSKLWNAGHDKQLYRCFFRVSCSYKQPQKNPLSDHTPHTKPSISPIFGMTRLPRPQPVPFHNSSPATGKCSHSRYLFR